MLEKMNMLRRIAVTNSTVLLIGEAGVGKELIAEQIHLSADRASYPFIRINCGCDNLNKVNNTGYGTVFFDEVSVLSLERQNELLNILQNENAEYRIIASTKEDLETCVKSKNFIEELYHRLNVLPIFIPALRNRPEDIIVLAKYFLQHYARETKKNITDFSYEALESLKKASWPGNVRELKNTVERVCINSDSAIISEPALLIRRDFRYTGTEDAGDWDLKEAVDAFKASYIERALEEYGLNQTLTAKALGIQRTYLSKLIKDLHIQRNTE